MLIRRAWLPLFWGPQVFPATSQTAQRIKAAVLAVRDAGSNSDDLKTMANMYSVGLEAESRKHGRCGAGSGAHACLPGTGPCVYIFPSGACADCDMLVLMHLLYAKLKVNVWGFAAGW